MRSKAIETIEIHEKRPSLVQPGSGIELRLILKCTLVFRHIRAVPPSTAQCLKQCCRVGITIGLRLHKVNQRLLFIGLNVCRPRGALSMQKDAALEDGLRNAAGYIPKAAAAAEYLAEETAIVWLIREDGMTVARGARQRTKNAHGRR
jgi:hypothetical protein